MPGDGGDYVAVRVAGGARFALTTTCAANVLGYTHAGLHAHGNREAARRAFAALAAFLDTTIEDAARAVLDCATDKVIPVIQGLIAEYQLDADQCLLIGEGGGAGALIPRMSERFGLRHEISEDAEVISSIGVALALVRDVVERIIPHPKPEDLQAIRREALEAVVRLGADPRGVDVTVEVDRLTHRVRAIAMGAAEMHVKDPGGSIPEREARAIAARSMSLGAETLHLAAETAGLRAYRSTSDGFGAVRVVDREGAIRMQRSRALVRTTTAAQAQQTIREVWKETAGGSGTGHASPGLLIHFGAHLVDLSGVESLDQAVALARSELEAEAEDAVVGVIGFGVG